MAVARKGRGRRSSPGSIMAILLVAVQPIGLHAQEVDAEGEWSARISTEAEAPVLRIEVRRWDRDGRWGSTLDLDDRTTSDILARLEAGDRDIHFIVEREAGVLRFDGSFTGRRGRGDFTFTEADSFRATMRDLGFGRLNDDEVFSAAILDVGPRKAAEMARIGFDRLDFDELVSSSIFDLDAETAAELNGLGLGRLDFDEMISARIHGVTADFVAGIRSMELGTLDFDQAQSMKIHGVTADFVEDTRAMGFRGLDYDDLISMKIHGLDRGYVEEMAELGYPLRDVDDAIAFRIHGVTPDFVRELEEAGFEGLDADELLRIRIMGLDDILRKRKPRRRSIRH